MRDCQYCPTSNKIVSWISPPQSLFWSQWTFLNLQKNSWYELSQFVFFHWTNEYFEIKIFTVFNLDGTTTKALQTPAEFSSRLHKALSLYFKVVCPNIDTDHEHSYFCLSVKLSPYNASFTCTKLYIKLQFCWPGRGYLLMREFGSVSCSEGK